MESEVADAIKINRDRIAKLQEKSGFFTELKEVCIANKCTAMIDAWGDIDVMYRTDDLSSVSNVLKALKNMGVERGKAEMIESDDGRWRTWHLPQLKLMAYLEDGVAGPKCELVQVGMTEPKPIMEMRCGDALEEAKAALT